MSSPAFLLLGTHYHGGSEQTLARQARARASLQALNGVRLVNLQFPDAVIDVDGIETVPRLFTDSVKASGEAGTRKPIGREAFDRLAECAETAGSPYFGWANSDITMTQDAVDYVRANSFDAVIFSRMDFDGSTGEDRGMFVGGLDVFVFSAAWWRENRHRYRPYVNSEAFWDPIYATIALCHGNAVVLNRRGLVRHEMHPRVWSQSPFTAYNRYFASLDTLYLDQWMRYRDELIKMRENGASEEEELAFQRSTFTWPPPLTARLWQAGRSVKHWCRYQLIEKRGSLVFR